MWAVALVTENERPEILYVKRETSWAPLTLPADWPAELSVLPKADPASLAMDYRTNARRVIFYYKTSQAEIQAATRDALAKDGFAQVTGKAAWRKGGITVVIANGSPYDTTLMVEYPAQ